MPVNWMKEGPAMPRWLAALYCVSVVGPAWHTLLGLIRDRDARWLWHTPACMGAVLGSIWGVLTYKRRGRDKGLIADLQVKQTLKQFEDEDKGEAAAMKKEEEREVIKDPGTN